MSSTYTSAELSKIELEEEYPESYLRLVERLEQLFTSEIAIKRSKNGGGKITIGFTNDTDIEEFINRLGN